jgi:poly [ADP-ribose] polymerase 1
VKCLKVDKQPKRKTCKLPEVLRTKFEFLAKYKSKVQNRVIKYFAPSGYLINSSVKKEENGGPSEPRIKREVPVLYNMEFIIIGKTKQSKEEIGEKIKQLGGKLTTKLHKKTSAVISTAEEVKKMGSRMSQAQELDIQVG